MGRFDRYMLSQCLLLFGFFSLILVLIFWVNRAVPLFDRIIADGQSALVFLELSSLRLPLIILQVIPISAFISVVYVTNRLSSDSELTIMQATGYSAVRMARPVLYFGIAIGIMVAILAHILVPLATERELVRDEELAADSTARLFRDGTFVHPNDTTTFYVREITPEGEMLDVFIWTRDETKDDEVYTSDRAFLVRGANGPQIVLIDGMAQSRIHETNRLSTTRFDDVVLDIPQNRGANGERVLKLREVSTSALFKMPPEIFEKTQATLGDLTQELHERLARPLFPLIASLLAFSVMVAGRFSRFGIWRQVVISLTLLVLIKVIEGAAAQAIQEQAANWPLAYLPAGIGIVISAGLLWKTSLRRRIPAVKQGAPA